MGNLDIAPDGRVFSERLMDILRERRLRPGDVARALHVTTTAVGYWLSGERRPKEDQLIGLSRYLGVHPAYLQWGCTPDAGIQDADTVSIVFKLKSMPVDKRSAIRRLVESM